MGFSENKQRERKKYYKQINTRKGAGKKKEEIEEMDWLPAKAKGRPQKEEEQGKKNRILERW